MSSTRMRVSIVIPAYNEERYLSACLDSIAAQTVPPFEVIVVDNNSNDRTAEVAARYPFVRVVPEPRQGRVFARNTGFENATGDIIGRIDADIVLPPDWAEALQAFYARPGSAAKAWTSGGDFYNVPLRRLVRFGFGLMAFGLNRVLLGYVSLWGSSTALTAAQWQAVRTKVCLRNDIHEDLDLTMHLADAGYRIHLDKKRMVRAELRRTFHNRTELWAYLSLWPNTLRVHRKVVWPICWFFGTLGLYIATYILVAAEKSYGLLSSRSSRKK